MELRHLRYFIAVAEELHFRRAAERLNISQPPLSQQIKLLELELGAALFERTNKKVELTQAGRLFLPEARATIERANRAAEVVRKSKQGELGELRIGLFPSAPLVPEISRSIRAYREQYPGVSLVLNELESQQQTLVLVNEGEDIAIVRSVAAPALPKTILSRRVVDEPLVVVMRSDHPLNRQAGSISMADLTDEPFVFYGEKMGAVLPRIVYDLCHDAGFEPRISQLASANTTMIGLVAAGLGIAIIPNALARLTHADIAVHPLKQKNATVSVWVLWNARRRSLLIDAFLKLI
ncbi:hypothetical protein ASD12_11790 [Mesorhizobium sp. Root102]|uniref:LysR substrate-binding domain-containing protein n=1 Tax=Mesorhizobium sp. Root102 TaxID=1736422 RepID=UPI0006F8D31B|nr:LysR substrate-binding domain-containing protein [Mesorhizobium sp. Root102]KQU80084.1 hypothetical protein ASD12_11790 [Mesorhizobium sp. Root102]